MNKKKLCLVIPSLQAGGMERVMSELLTHFAAKEINEIHLVLYGISRGIFYSVPEKVKIHKPQFIFNNNQRFFSTLKTLHFLRNIIKEINPDSILSFGEYWNSFVLFALWGLRFPIYISDRCSPEKKFNKVHTILRWWLYPRSKGIIAQTKRAKLIYESRFNINNICVIGNPIHISSTIEIPDTKENIVLTIGRLIKSKNHDKLIELFCKINNPNWKLIIVGGDALGQENMTRLRKLICSLGADTRVILTGYKNDLSIYYRLSKIFAFTSESEGFPNVIGEAMSEGLPVISFDCVAGPSEMITDGENGYLIPINNYSLFRERLEKLMTDEWLCKEMGSKAKKSIIKFSSDHIGDKYYKFITKD